MRWFAISLRDGGGVSQPIGTTEFASMDDACADARAATPELLADLVRAGLNPSGYVFCIVDLDDGHVRNVAISCALPG